MRPDEQWGRRKHVIVEPLDHASPPIPDALREHVRTNLAAYEVPKTVEFVTRIPRSDAGKVSRSSLAAERAQALAAAPTTRS